MKESILEKVKNLETELRVLRRGIRALKVPRVNRRDLMEGARRAVEIWFDQVEPNLPGFLGVQQEKLKDLRDHFKHLLKISSPNNLSSSYLEDLNYLLKHLRSEVVTPIVTSIPANGRSGEIKNLIETAGSAEVREYLAEALKCAEVECLRATIVLGWCAAIDHLHRYIANTGFDTFNTTSTSMKNLKTGRLKNWTKEFRISSLGDLRTVFDQDILWVLEGMGVIDPNEHRRLSNCFDLRSQCAHPGQAPVTWPNAVSFYSDIAEIILKNPRFALRLRAE